MASAGNNTPNLSNFQQVQNPQTIAAQVASGGATATGADMPTAQASNVPAWMSRLAGASAAQNAQGSGTAGAVGNMPTWQKGLAGVVTGSPAFGANAPALHQLLTSGLQMMQQGQGQGGQMQRPMQRPMGQMAAPPGVPASASPQMPQSPPMGASPQGGMNPQMLQQLMQTNPQLAQQLMQQMQQQGGAQGLMGH